MAKSVGRPVVFTGKVSRHIVALVRRTNINEAIRQLAAEEPSISISAPTVRKLCDAAGLERKVGRPKVRKVA